MARLTNPEILARYRQALADWKLSEAIRFDGRAAEGLETTLEGATQRDFKEALYDFVFRENGEIDQVKEEREPWRMNWEFHYDLRPTFEGRKIYVETRLWPEDFSRRDDPVIYVVQIKPA